MTIGHGQEMILTLITHIISFISCLYLPTFRSQAIKLSKKVQVGNDQEIAQLERNFHSINRGVRKN